MAKKDMTIKIAADQVMFSNISKSKDGYNSARVVAKIADNEYMSVSYEWEGSAIPDFAMSLMGFMQANKLEMGKEYEEDAAAKCGSPSKKKKKKGKKMDDEDASEDE